MPTTVRSTPSLLLTLTAALTLAGPLSAQTPASSFTQPPAPIERATPADSAPAYPATYPNGHPTAAPADNAASPDTPRRYQAPPAVKTSQPAQGVYVRVSPQGAVSTVTASATQTELRVEGGIANISVHHPAQNSTILVDFAGGQLDLVKDGMYTFNADTKTARVLVGEAQAFPGTDPNARPVKVKEDHSVTFGTADLHSVGFQLYDARGDVLPRDNAASHGDGPTPYPAYGFYGDYPYYAYGYPYYGWGYPYGFGLGFGFYGGGFYGGGYRGGFRGRR